MFCGALLAACSPTVVSPGGGHGAFLTAPPGVTFAASISKARLQLGDTATLRFILANNAADTLRMTFGSGCPILPYVVDGQGDMAYPSGGGWACTAAITNVALAPGEKREVTVPVTAAGRPHIMTLTGAVLDVGQYSAYAELTNGAGRTNRVAFTISR